MSADVRRLARGTLLASFPGAEVPPWLWRSAEAGLGGVCLYGSNRGVDVAAVAAGLHAARPELVVALDEEGGDVTRLEAATGSSVPGNAALGAVDDVDLTRRVGRVLGDVLRATGVDLDLAPCADVNSDPDNPVIGVRSFGADADLVARHVVPFAAGLQRAGVAACAKHFPGHGAVAVDSHVALPVVGACADVLHGRELVPFRAAVDTGIAAVMPGHLLVPALDDVPATVSPRVIGDVLRDGAGFGGVVVTDALDMGGAGGPDAIPAMAVRALAAGADLCCLGPDSDEALVEACVAAVAAAVDAGPLPVERLAEAAARVASLRDLASVAAAGVHEGRQNRRDPGRGSILASVAADGVHYGRQIDRDPATTEPGATPELASARARLADVGRQGAERALRLDGDPPGSLTGAHVVELDRPLNIAAGDIPWTLAGPLQALDPTVTCTRVTEGDGDAVRSAIDTAAGRPVVVAVRDAHRRPAQAVALAALAAARPDAVVVDLGWPAGPADRPPVAAWITTFGASRASREAVAELLTTLPTTAGRISRG